MLNAMLSNTCPVRSEGDVRLFQFNLHCNTMWVVAKVKPNSEEEVIEYEILGWKIQGSRTNAQLNIWAGGFFNA